MKNLLLALMSVPFVLAATTAKADLLTLDLSSPYQTGTPGGVLMFDATMTNDTTQVVYLNGDNPSVDSPLVVDDSPFNNGFPLSLGAGDSYSGELFAVDLPDDTPSGLYAGAFEITGGFGSSDTDVAGTADFNVNVTPEPASFVLLATGLMCGVVALGMHRRRSIV